MTRRRWIADTWDQSSATLQGDQAQHLSRVLRALPGMEFDVVAGGQVWLARITSVDKDSVRFALIAEVETSISQPLTLLLSVFKFDRMEWAIEKAVELGCSRIVPVLAERTEKHLAQAAAKRVERWRRVAREAAKQSRRSNLPEIDEPVRLAKMLQTEVSQNMPEEHGPVPSPLRLLLSEVEEDQPLLRILEESASEAEVWLAVGPEGGWTSQELTLFASAGWQSATLGPHILRVETAVIAALAVIGAGRASAVAGGRSKLLR